MWKSVSDKKINKPNEDEKLHKYCFVNTFNLGVLLCAL